MENFNIFIDYIARTNLFNFVIFLSIIIFLVKKINISAKLEDSQNTIKETIDNSEETKLESEKRLNSIEASIANIEEEINTILQKSEENAKLVGEKILQDAEKTALTIQENTSKSIQNSQTLLKNELLKRASLASIEVAKNHIINELSWNQELHDKLINESIEALEGVNNGGA
ncbi:ATP synthase F0 subunit B [bacterium]|nr:ATP synthase F0 subunit B [bacterium]